MLVPPGELYDPLEIIPDRDCVLLNDDGLESGGHGSRLLAVSLTGKISELVGASQLLPMTGFDLAPQGFGNFAGQAFALSQPATGMNGASANHVIQRIDLATKTTSVFCTLPTSGSVAKGVAGYGFEARFGPPHSRFANRLFSVTALNDTIYETTADGTCRPFADTSPIGAPGGIAFAPDGSEMLVAMAPDMFPSADSKPKGGIFRISSDGKFNPNPVITGIVGPSGIAFAPPSFGKYAGQIFVTDTGNMQVPVPQAKPLKPDGTIYRVNQQGELTLVASGFINPVCLCFVNEHLLISDINGDFIAGGRELPDGFLVQLDRD